MQLIWCLLSNFYLNMFRASLCPSSGEQECALPHMVFCTGCDGCGCVELGRELCALWKLLFDCYCLHGQTSVNFNEKITRRFTNYTLCCLQNGAWGKHKTRQATSRITVRHIVTCSRSRNHFRGGNTTVRSACCRNAYHCLSIHPVL